MTPFIRDDFAAGGGWSWGLKLLGLAESVGIEFDAAAVATARAAGHSRWHIDVRSDECRNYPWPPMWLYIASPPCQTFSMAGKGAGRQHLEALVKALHLVAGGMLPEEAIAAVADDALDERSILVLEPMLVIRRHGPINVALEQVPPVLPVWEAYAEIMRSWGYSVWAGFVHSEQFGVPQTRKRAVLMGSRERVVAPPKPTHSKFHSHNPTKLDDGVLPWVSMAQALGVASSMRSNYGTSGNPENRGEREATEPAPTMTGKAGRNFWVLQGNQKPNGVDYQQRSIDNPAQTITGETGSFMFVQSARNRATSRLADQPAPTITGSRDYNERNWVPDAPNGGDTSWSERRPSPTIIGSYAPDVVAAPKYRKAGDGPRQKAPGSIRVTVEEAGVLQSFPADYPWQGKKGKQFEQVGNAVPPVMAAAILAALLGLDPTWPRAAS